MKKQRALPFGYGMRNGRIEVNGQEAAIVRSIYRMYEAGGSLEAIAKTMNRENIPYSAGCPIWNKHQIKRILEDARYIGNDRFPAILSKEQFDTVRELYAARTAPWQTTAENPEKYIWKRLRCLDCGGRIKRIGGRTKDTMILECEGCKKRVSFNIDEFKEKLLTKLQEALAPAKQLTTYQPTQELLENEIGHGIEKPIDGKSNRRLILQAAAMRYSLCPGVMQEEPKADWRLFKDRVIAAHIGAREIRLQLKQ